MRSPHLFILQLLDSAHALAHGFLALDVYDVRFVDGPVDHGVGDGAVAELRVPRRWRELRARYEWAGAVSWVDGLLAGLEGFLSVFLQWPMAFSHPGFSVD